MNIVVHCMNACNIFCYADLLKPLANVEIIERSVIVVGSYLICLNLNTLLLAKQNEQDLDTVLLSL